jgi:circadian clock protein KaiC
MARTEDKIPAAPPAIPVQVRVSTGIEGLDRVLGGGLPSRHLYLVEGTPGTGKTTLGLQFLLEGVARGESGLYVTLSETAEELATVAGSHGWRLDGMEVFELVSREGLGEEAEQSILHPSEVELGETTRGVMAAVQRLQPSRVVFDSLSEMRLLAQDPLRYRRQILALKHFFATCQCTVLMLDDLSSQAGDLQLHSIAHGVLCLDQSSTSYGPSRRHLRIVKMRGVSFRGGEHDFALETGGVRVFPRLVAAEHHAHFSADVTSTSVPRLDALLGGGLVRGSNTLFTGPSGVGKTTTAMACALAALRRGESAVYYLFDEGLVTLLPRCKALGLDIEPYLANGQLRVHTLDPAEVSAGQFASMVRESVERDGRRMVVIDSLNAYLQAMPGSKFLLLQMHELLTYLNQLGILTVLILGQHGLAGEVRSDVDLSYLSDAIVLFRFFEAQGRLLKAVSVVKSRVADHELFLREFALSRGGVQIGLPLADFDGVLGELPSYRGQVPLLGSGETAGA